MFRTRLISFLIVAGLCITPVVHAATGDPDFMEGVKAFKAGNYAQAISAFERAQRKGRHDSALYYNLGVSYYKNQQYRQSDAAFVHLLSDKKFQQLARYNIGLVTLAEKQTTQAAHWFRKAIDPNGNQKINTLARRMLDKYDVQKPSSKPTVSGLLSLGYGHDSNVTLASTGSPTQRSDNYSQLFGFIAIPAGPIRINASVFRQDYQTVNSADFQQLSAGVEYPFAVNRWALSPGVYLAKDDLNGKAFLTVTDFRFSASRYLAHGRLQFRYRYSDVKADDTAYNYLQGKRQQFRVQHTGDTGLGQLRLRYELEINNRQNLSTANYSPTRHTLMARLQQHPAQGWRTREEISWRDSQYGDVAGFTRSDTRYQFNLSADKRVTHSIRAGLTYTYSDNSSNQTSQSYTRNDVMGYLNWLF